MSPFRSSSMPLPHSSSTQNMRQSGSSQSVSPSPSSSRPSKQSSLTSHSPRQSPSSQSTSPSRSLSRPSKQSSNMGRQSNPSRQSRSSQSTDPSASSSMPLRQSSGLTSPLRRMLRTKSPSDDPNPSTMTKTSIPRRSVTTTSDCRPPPVSSSHPRLGPVQLPVRSSRRVSKVDPAVEKVKLPSLGAVHV